MRNFRTIIKRLTYTGLVVGSGAVVIAYVYPKSVYDTKTSNNSVEAAYDQKYAYAPLPSRKQQLDSLATKEFDVLVIGGGVTGAGVALDSISRGLTTAMVEKYDFGSGTSSRSTKLIYGDIRYLQKAVFNLDFAQGLTALYSTI